MMLHRAAVENAITFQYDWTNAHQNTLRPKEFNRAVWSPKGMPQYVNGERAVYLPNTFIQGEREAAAFWLDLLYTRHGEWGLQRCVFDRNAFVRFEGDEWLILCVVVDDVSGATNSKRLLADFDTHMRKHPVTGGGEIDWLLNNKYIRDRAARTISISFRARIDAMMLEHLPDEMRRVKYPPTPCHPHLDNLASAPEIEMSSERYQKVRRCLAQLLYLAKQGRFELLYFVHRASVSISRKSKLLEECIFYALLYVFGTRDVHLVLGGDNHIVSAAADGAFSDPGPCVTVWAVKIGASTIQAVARKPGFTTLSTSDQELVAVSGCVASVLAFRELAREFGMPQHDASKIGCDNNSVVLISRAAASFKSSLYLARRAVFVQESTQDRHCEVEDIDTKVNYSDILSKNFHKHPKLFASHRDRLLNAVSLMPS